MRSALRLAIRLALVAALVIAVASVTDLGLLAEHFTLDLLWAMLAVQPLVLLIVAVTAWRHAMMLRAPRRLFARAFRAVLLSVGLNLLLPARLSELIKATYMRDHADISLGAGMAAVLVERLTDVVLLGLLAALSAALLLIELQVAAIAVVAATAVLALAVLWRAEGALKWMASHLPGERLRTFANRLLTQASSHVREGRAYLALLLGAVIWAAAVAVIGGILVLAGGIPIGLAGVLAVFVATTLGGAIPALPAGLGTYEAAAVLALGQFGYGFEEALALALTMHMAQFILTIPLSAVIMLTQRIGLSKVFHDALAAWRP